MKWAVEHIIDVVSKNPDHYTRYRIIEADTGVEAIKKFVVISVKDECKESFSKWVEGLSNDVDILKQELLECNIVVTNVEPIK